MDTYHFVRSFAKTVLLPIYRFEVKGLEHFPKSGGVLICTNHINVLDPPVVGITAPRPVHFMAKEELFRTPILKPLLPKLNAFPVKRGLSDREALRRALAILKGGDVMGLFPEGTRSENGELGKGFSGAGFFALKGEADVVPCAIIGPYKTFKRLKVVYGEPILMQPYRDNKASADEVTLVIMDRIKNLIDENK